MKIQSILPLSLLASCSLASAAFEIKETQGAHIDILDGGKVVARMMTAHDTSTPEKLHETYKVYTHVFDAEGKEPITKGAGGKFTHHRGIYIGWSKTKFDGKGVDSWHMKNCFQVYQKTLKAEAGEESATLTVLIHWVTTDGLVFIEEERTQTFTRGGDGAMLQVDFDTVLKAPLADVELKGDPEHAGCQFRPSNAVADNGSAKYLFPEGVTDVKKERDLPWAAESFKIGDKTYFAQHMSHPTTPKGNIYSAYRDYGRFGAFCVATVPKGESLRLRYRIVVGEGEMPEREVFAKRSAEFAK